MTFIIPPQLPAGSYPGSVAPYSNVTPFLHRNARTEILQIEDLIHWVNNNLIVFLNDEITRLVADLNVQYNALRVAMDEYNETAKADQAEFARVTAERQTAFEATVQAAQTLIEEASAHVNEGVAEAAASAVKAEEWAANTQLLQDLSMSRLVLDKMSATNRAMDVVRQSYNLLESGAIGDGVTNDTAAIQAFLDAMPNNSVLVGQTGKTYLIDRLIVRDKAGFVFDGNGATLKLASTVSAARADAIGLQGVLTDVTIRGWIIIGTGVVEHRHCGVRASGAAVITNIRIENNTIRNVTIGISVSADTAGASALAVTIVNNYVQGVTGVESGTGYGIHTAIAGSGNTGVVIANNTVRSAQRHSIYCAKGRGAVITGNTVLDHRDTSKDSSIRPAITVARCSEVIITGNSVIRPAGAALLLGPKIDGEIVAGAYTVNGNVFADPQDGAALVYIGTQGPAAEGIPMGVTFIGNTLTSSKAATLLVVWNGKGIKIADNMLQIRGAGACSGIAISPQGVTGNDYLDDLILSGNILDMDADNPTSKVGIRLSPGVGLLTGRMAFRANRLMAGAVLFATSESVTNPNMSIIDQLPTGIGFAAGNGAAPFEFSTRVQTAAPAAGSAPVLPATPNGYADVVINGTVRKIAYY